MYVNTVVVVGDRFDFGMFSTGELFDGNVDSGRVVVGPFARLTYHSGRCEFASRPDRMDIVVRSPEIMPVELRSAALAVLGTLDSLRAAVTITGVGLNCDVALPREAGVEICNGVANMELLAAITGAGTLQVKTTTTYERGKLRYEVRIEPEPQSQGRNLFVAANGHQTVGPADRVEPTLGQYDDFRNHVKELHARINSKLT